MLITYYPNLQPYIEEERVYGKRACYVYIYNVSGQVINKLYYINGRINNISYWQNYHQHNLHGPAWIEWYNGQICYISYWQSGIRHNLHGPAYIGWCNDQIITEYWRNGKLIQKYKF